DRAVDLQEGPHDLLIAREGGQRQGLAAGDGKAVGGAAEGEHHPTNLVLNGAGLVDGVRVVEHDGGGGGVEGGGGRGVQGQGAAVEDEGGRPEGVGRRGVGAAHGHQLAGLDVDGRAGDGAGRGGRGVGEEELTAAGLDQGEGGGRRRRGR